MDYQSFITPSILPVSPEEQFLLHLVASNFSKKNKLSVRSGTNYSFGKLIVNDEKYKIIFVYYPYLMLDTENLKNNAAGVSMFVLKYPKQKELPDKIILDSDLKFVHTGEQYKDRDVEVHCYEICFGISNDFVPCSYITER